MLKSVRKYIENKRGNPKFMWRFLVWLKDRGSDVIVWLHDRIVRRKYNLHKNLTEKYNQSLYDGFQFMEHTRPIACNPEAPVEVHTLTSHHHIWMYVASLKSLLQHYGNIAVVAHNGDDSLTSEDKIALHHHIPGISIIEKEAGEKVVYPMLAKYPRTLAYRKKVINSIELLDHILLAKNKKIITMNSDILFFAEPKELIAWIEDPEDRIMYVHEEYPDGQEQFLAELGCKFPPHVTIALACFPKDILDLQYVEDILQKTKRAIWSTGQRIYPALFDKIASSYPASSFDQKVYAASGIFTETDIFRHYWASTGKFTEQYISDAKRISSGLMGE